MGRPRRLAKQIDGATAFQSAVSIAGLQRGWDRVWRNAGGAGSDGVTVEAFAASAGPRLAALSRSLTEGSYRPRPCRLVEIPKSSGGKRRLSIPTVTDRVCQTALALVLGPLLDEEMEEGSFGYRPGRGVAQAVARVEALRREGYVWTLDADIDDFFDTIPIDNLMERLRRSITESPATELIGLWLETGATAGRGIAQGSPLSPLLANLYLDDLDEAVEADGLRIVRYADDFLVLARDRPNAERAAQSVAKILARHGLTLDPGKTRLRGYDEALRFLGRVFVRGWMLEGGDEALPESPDLAMRRVAETDTAEAERIARAQDETRDAEDAGLDRAWRLLHLREPGRRLTLRNLSFSVHEAPEPGQTRPKELIAIHPNGLDRIELGPQVSIDPEALRHALAHGIPLAFTDGHGESLGQLAPVLAPRAGRHLAQARHVLDPALRLALCRRLVSGRIANQRALLRRVNHRRGVVAVADVASRLGPILRKTEHAVSVEALMGCEGEAAKLYWRGFGALLLHGFSFGPRRRRASADAVNIALDVTAGLLARDVGAVLLTAGLHPGFGALHATGDGRDACVYDIMEEFRAGLAESTVLYAINTGALTQAMVQPLPGGTLRLASAGMRALVRAYEDRAESRIVSRRSGHRLSWRRILREQAHAYAAHVEGGAAYEPFRLDH